MIRTDLNPDHVTTTPHSGCHLVGWLFTDEKVGMSVIKDVAGEIQRLRKALEIISSGELSFPEQFANDALHAPPPR